MAQRAHSRVFSRAQKSPGEIQRALRNFSENASAFSLTKEEALEKYKDKWIAIYKGEVTAVADTLNQLATAIADQRIPASETLFRHIDPKDKVFIL
jgi:phosphoenolpyruvate carboxylase